MAPSADGSPAQRRESARWGGVLRRAATDLPTIVAGVLIALAVNSWWQDRQDRLRERTYLSELREDANENERRLNAALDEEQRTLLSLERMVEALRAPQLPPPDSFMVWIRGGPFNYADPRLLLGTVAALQQTDDLRLIEDDRLRVAIVAYAGSVDKDWDEFSRWVGLAAGAFVGVSQAVVRGTRPPYRKDDVRTQALALRALASDPQVPALLEQAVVAAHNRVFYLRRMRDDTSQLLRLLDAATRS